MKKIIQMTDLDCAHCASKMEQAISKIEGVNSVTINFMTQKMTLDCDDDCYNAVVEEARKICKKIEPHCLLKF